MITAWYFGIPALTAAAMFAIINPDRALAKRVALQQEADDLAFFRALNADRAS